MVNLDRSRFGVAQTAANGVVGTDTRLEFQQHGSRVVGRYHGGSILRGCLVGEVFDRILQFRYVQREESGELHAGYSKCTLGVSTDGRRQITEHFQWATRPGSGINVFEEITDAS